MFTSINISTAALAAFSRALDAVSNNVANLNTTGYKGSRPDFSAQFAQGRSGQGATGGAVGQGVSGMTSVVNFKPGDFSQTKEGLELAIDGGGFFVLKDGQGRYSYTKNGRFQVADGYLVGENGQRVQGIGPDGALGDITVGGALAINPFRTTQMLSHAQGAVLSTGIPSPYAATMQPFNVYDCSGGVWSLNVKYTNLNPTPSPTDSSLRWKVEILDSKNNVIATDELLFNATGNAPDPSHTSFDFSYRPGGNSALQMALKLDYSKLQCYSAGTTATGIQVTADGMPRGTVSKQEFDEDGNFVITYSNGQTDKSQRIALARFSALGQLRQVSGGTFVPESGAAPTFGQAGDDGDKLKVGFLEKSNVDLASEFSDIIVIQRSYQAATETISTANQMLGNVLDMKRGG